MQDRKLSVGLTLMLAMLALATHTMCASAQTETLLHSFSFGENGKDGSTPYSTLAIDASGNLYGTTFFGGAYNYGTVFEVSPKAGGGWTEKILHSFNAKGGDGQEPYAGVVLDAAGNLFGTTESGSDGYGTVFELSPKAGGGWTESILHSFNTKGGNGYGPSASLVLDAAGDLYGTTRFGGAYGYGTVFELSPKEGGGWTETPLHNFNTVNRGEPQSYNGLILDGAGNLYGTSTVGGSYGAGSVFELSPAEGGGWTETVLHNFNDVRIEGGEPHGGLVFDAAGNLYGTASIGGPGNWGVVFELTLAGDGTWKETILHSFNRYGPDGSGPNAGLIFDGDSNLYGTTAYGGPSESGTVFELTPVGDGVWTETTLYAFQHKGGRDGHFPFGGLVFDSVGNLYGTTYEGGDDGLGTVFEITP